MKDLNIKFKVPESKTEAVEVAKKYWQKLSKIVDCAAEVIAETIKKEVKKHG